MKPATESANGVSASQINRKQPENLMHCAQRFRSLYEFSPIGILRRVNNGTLVANNQFLAMLGYSQDEFEPLDRDDITHPEDQLIHVELSEKLIKGEIDFYKLSKRYIRKDGTSCSCKITVTAVLDEYGDHLENLILVEDVSICVQANKTLEEHLNLLKERSKQLERYAESNKELENFAYVASHDLKEPLRTIGNFANLLKIRLGNKLDDTDKEFMDYIMGGVKNMNHLIEGLLAYSRVNTSEHKLESIKLNDLLFVLQHSLDKTIAETQTIIEIGKMPECIVGNKLKLKQLFQNLLVNAIKFQKADQPPKIVIAAKEKELYWEFSVKDNGIGIRDEYQAKIFQLFKRLHPRNKYPGCGIGLSICKRIVEQHGGEISVISAEDEGTEFVFTIKKNIEMSN